MKLNFTYNKYVVLKVLPLSRHVPLTHQILPVIWNITSGSEP